MGYYDGIAEGYDELHGAEQIDKIKVILKLLDKHDIKFNSVLDVGCGTGIASEYFNNFTGIDPSAGLLKIAQNKQGKYIQASAEQLPFNDKQFDLVISITAIQNFDNIEQGLIEIKRVGKHFALTYLKKSPKAKQIESIINKFFTVIERYEEEKDIIFLLR